MKNVWLPAACMCMLLWAGCRKEDDMIPGQKPSEAVMAKSGCTPHETVEGVMVVPDELNLFTACQLDQPCEGGERWVTYKHQLSRPGGGVFVYTDYSESFTPAEQQELLDAAMYWAWQNCPPGYSIVGIKFQWELYTSTGSRWYFGIEVTYRKCAGTRCAPYQSLSGRGPLITDLNRYFSGACNSSAPACPGSYVTTTMTDILKSPFGVPYVFNDAVIINVATQNEIITAANIRAAAMKPAGYTLTDIDITPGPGGQLIITAKYMKCTGGGNT